MPTDLALAARAEGAGEPVAGLLHGGLPVHRAAVGVVDPVGQGEHAHGPLRGSVGDE
ncbi:hypothetical protein ABT288_42210 [Streptomyces sp. NPDC001093]|uniref:hypothetical protein n=1 Tax=Streptomyces sp. NPDC001093 TaxID=3154376 RepID=UPI00332D5F9E